MSTDSNIIVWLAFLGVAASIAVGFIECSAGYDECTSTVGDRPCIQGTVRYDGDGECECDTRHGELEWNIYGQGCDME